MTLGLFVLMLFAARAFCAVQLEAGFLYGVRAVNDAAFRDISGKGTSYFPHVGLHLWQGLFLGAGYDHSLNKGKVGLYHDATTLDITGVELFFGYELRLGPASPYLKAGYGFYSYSQTFEDPHLKDFEARGKKGAVLFGGGVKIFFIKSVYLNAEGTYISLKVKPFEDEVDLGGVRFQGGLGVRF
jgi:hypothetical protein